MMEIDDGEGKEKLTPTQTRSTDSHSLSTQKQVDYAGTGGRGDEWMKDDEKND